MPFDLSLPPKLFVPQKPAIIRASRVPESPAEARQIQYAPKRALGAGGAAMMMGGSPVANELTYLGPLSLVSTTNSFNLGNIAVPKDGLLIVAAGKRGGSDGVTAVSVSIGGSNGSIAVTPTAARQDSASVIAAREVSAGNNNITINWSGNGAACAAFCYLMTGFASATAAAFDGINADTFGTSINATFTLPANSAAVYMALHNNTNATSWANAVLDDDLTVNSVRYSSASLVTAAELVSRTATASWSGSVARAIVGAVYQFA